MARSIRQGLFIALAGFTVFICLCYTGLTLVIAYVTEDMLVDRILQREAMAQAAHLRLHGRPARPANDLVRVYTAVDALPALVRESGLAGHRRAEIFTDTGQHYHLRALDLETGDGVRRIYLLADVAPLLVVSNLVREVGGVLAAVAGGLIGLALLLAWLLSRRLVLPLQVLAREVRSVRPGGPVVLSARRRRDEIGYVAEKLGTTLAELHAALAREHAFTRDVGHELRTPLTVMKNILVQAGGRPLAGQDIAQLQAGIDEIAKTVDVLFALARAGHVADEPFDLRACIEDSLLRLLDGAAPPASLTLDLPQRLVVRGSPHLATLLINNCLGNALFHGGSRSRLHLSFAQGCLVLANSIEPGRTGAVQGFMHGQNLLLRIAAAMRWEVRFHPGASSYRVDIVARPGP